MPIPSTATSERLLLPLVVFGAGLSALLAALRAASASAASSSSIRFRASLTRRFCSASFLPAATRAGFGLVFGGSAVTRAGVGVGAAVVSSGIVCEVAMESILRCSEFYKVAARSLPGCCQVAARLLPGCCQVAARVFKLHQDLRGDNLPCRGWGVLLVLCAGPSSRAQVSSQVARVWP